MKPKISVIIPVYNVEKFLERSVSSVVEQDFYDIEIIFVVEERSTDNSVAMCEKLAAGNEKMRIFKEYGTGVSVARNVGLEKSTGEYISFVDADDYILPGMFSFMYSLAVHNDLEILTCGAKKFLNGSDEKGYWIKFDNEIIEITPENQRNFMYRWTLRGRASCVWGKLYKRKFIESNNLKFNKDVYAEDVVFNYSCYTAAKRVGSVDKAFYMYYDRPGSRLYSSDISEVERSHSIWWNLYMGYDGSGSEDVKSFAATRIISSVMFNMKLQGQSLETISCFTDEFIRSQGMLPYLLQAADYRKFADYAKITGMEELASDNYYGFIKSLTGGYDSILEWQNRYAKIENKEMIKWTMR